MKGILFDAADAVRHSISKVDFSKMGEEVGMGADGTPTQHIDRIAEEAVIKVLESYKNPLNVLSEEHEYIDNGAEYTLVLDPIDGTFNAVHGIPFFGTSLAIGKDKLSTIEYALVKDLVRGTMYYAEKGKGAYADGKRIHTRPMGKKLAFSVYLGEMAEKRSFEVATLGRRVRSMGAASLELCLVAEGAFDLYYLYTRIPAKLRVMDIAAGALIVKEAGGEVLEPSDNSVLDMNMDHKARTDIMAIGDKKLLEVLG
jgi:fructose-1,6-bisphosphatase/inositol monophosphatase family enzyme